MSLQETQAEQDRCVRLDLKRRLRLAGFESNLTAVSDITALRQLLDRQIQYTSGQGVEVEFANLGWVPGHFNRYVRRPEEDVRRASVEALGGGHELFLERIRPVSMSVRRKA